MNQNRHPAGTSAGGKFASGAAGEVDDVLDADSQGREEFSQKYPDRMVGIGRLVGDDEACEAAEGALARSEASDEFNANLTSAVRGVSARHPGAVSVSIRTEYSRTVVTGDYKDARGRTRRLDESCAEELQRVYDSDPISGYKVLAEDGVYAKSGRDDYEIDVSGVAGGSKITTTRPFNDQDASRLIGNQRASSSFMVTRRDGQDTFHYISGGKVWWGRLPTEGEKA